MNASLQVKSDLTDGQPAATALDVFGDLFDERIAETAALIAWPPAFAPQARRDLTEALRERLVWAHELALYEDFAVFRILSERQAAEGTATRPDWFAVWHVGMQQQGGFDRLLEKRPLLTEYSEQITAQWCRNTQALIARLTADRPTLIAEGFLAEGAGAVTEVTQGLSDPHDGGQSVAILRFEDGTRLVYKPRSMEGDARFHAHIADLTAKGAPEALRAPRVLARAGYGWAEVIEAAPLRDPADAGRFYARAGALLALLQRLRATDFHFENVIACGECPVPVDLETLFQPLDNPARPTPIRAEMVRRSVLSIYSTHYLTSRAAGGVVGEMADPSGRENDAELSQQVWRYSNPRTAGMRRGQHAVPVERATNLPHFEGETIPAKPHARAMVDGYEAYQSFLEHALEPGWDARYADVPLRWVRRATQEYGDLQDAVRLPETLASVEARDALLKTKVTAPVEAVAEAERIALCRLDVPKFTFQRDDNRVWENGDEVARDAITPADPWPSFGWNIQSEATSLGLTLDQHWVLRQQPLLEDLPTPLTAEAAIAEATRLGDYLISRATCADGRANWHGLDIPQGGERFDVCPMEADLYSGLAGPVLFLTLLAKMTHEPRFGAMADAAALTLTDGLHGRLDTPMPSGGFSGPLSGAYGLDLAAELRGEATPSAATALAMALSPEALRSDRALDIVGGSAGLILILLRFWRRTGHAGFLDRAEIAARVLHEHAESAEHGLWSTAQAARPLVGFSHGTTGIRFALDTLRAARPSALLDVLIARAARYEADIVRRSGGRIPDLRPEGATPETATCPDQWCHGMGGAALAQSFSEGRWPMADGPEAACAQLAQSSKTRLDDLCCGAMGQVMILDQAGRRMGQEDLRITARRRAAACLSHAARAGSYRLFSGDMFYAPGFMKGVSGIGYAFLSLGSVERVPNPLCLE
ncbi:lantibiotic modifying enzyme [Rubricella aquisinus]|uniref:Lantibiotic modifying enzyme n=1 Tax=Rubricella aquisinus TaxID=2028108 RepID=A0A840WLH9_9RHOB|nr:type 2 lanthipeptide synthetase LanM family protein [Rubricella aquisinus]MBB5515381.1 lantibiotic modifying enzyme [Rubricella aquisinus]